MSKEYVPPLGPRFSQIYIERTIPPPDSPRLRVRIAALFQRNFADPSTARDIIEIRLGAELDYVHGAHDIAAFLHRCPARDFYDFVTVYGAALREKAESSRYSSDANRANAWIELCRSTFIEENVAYRVDQEGVVRPLVDAEYDKNLSSMLLGLTDKRLQAVRAEVENAKAELERTEPAPKAAIRAIFEAMEIYCKLVVPDDKVQRLDANAILHHLLPLIQNKPGMFTPAKEVAEHLANSIVDWIKGAHLYRHGQNVTEPSPPPFDMAVAYVSTGIAYLRWLIDNSSHNLQANST